jgi:hypothetical protein
MPPTKLGVWVTVPFPRTFTHVVKGSFADPQSATQGATDLFCYDRSSGIAKFFATVRSGKLNDGTIVQDGLRQVGPNHASFSEQWTHVVSGRFTDPFRPNRIQLLLYDATTGTGEFYATNGRGSLDLIRRHTGLPRSLTKIIAGRFVPNIPGLLFYDASAGTGEFHVVDADGNMNLTRSFDNWRTTWHTIITGNFSNGPLDDLLFYDKGAGVGEFYKVHDRAQMTQLNFHDTWRHSWQHIVSGQFLQNSPFDGLLFYEENSGFTEFYSTNGSGGISQIDIAVGNQWSLPWHTILTGEFTPNIGLVGTSRLCAYDASGGNVRHFFLEPAVVNTIINLNGRWTAGGPQSAVITTALPSLTVDMSAFQRPPAQGTVVDADTITVTFPDDATFTGTLQPPNRIRWSNGTTWTKL